MSRQDDINEELEFYKQLRERIKQLRIDIQKHQMLIPLEDEDDDDKDSPPFIGKDIQKFESISSYIKRKLFPTTTCVLSKTGVSLCMMSSIA